MHDNFTVFQLSKIECKYSDYITMQNKLENTEKEINLLKQELYNFKNDLLQQINILNIYNQHSPIVLCLLNSLSMFNLTDNMQYIFGIHNIFNSEQISKIIGSKLIKSHNINYNLSPNFVNKLFEYIIIPINKIIILLDSKKIYTSGIHYNIQLGSCTWMGLEQDQEELFLTLKMCGYDW